MPVRLQVELCRRSPSRTDLAKGARPILIVMPSRPTMHSVRGFLVSIVLVPAVFSVAACGGDEGTGGDHAHDHHHGDAHGHGGHAVDSSTVVDIRFEVEFSDGSVVGGVPRLVVDVGDVVEVVVVSDMADELHLHVYDAVVDLEPGRPASILVQASIPGIFEAELHDSGRQVFELEVS